MVPQSIHPSIARSPDSNLKVFSVALEETGTRLDLFLSKKMPDWTRSQVQRLVRDGLVEINGRVARKSGETVERGSAVAVRAERSEPRAIAEDLPLEILYEDDDLTVVNKPAGMIVHAGAGMKTGTLVNALLHHLGGTERLSALGGDLRPGIVHRLDRMTSGLVLVAKNDIAHRVLASQFKSREVRKTYLALVHGRVTSDRGEIARPVGRDPRRRIRMRVGGLRAREASTEYRVLRRFTHFTLVEAHPRTGRTHQLRVHFASIGHPVAGDTLYGAPARIQIGTTARDTLARTFLHAAAIEFQHPGMGKAMKFEAPLPAELEHFLQELTESER
jgi:23S rRNA pseudouridine1911/1915/1917 synthase